MRLLSALAAALALAACQVNLEGAACAQPGAGDQCPSGQRCGNDLRCSERAAACAHRCTASERGCIDGGVRTCEDTDPVCGTWRLDEDCAARSLDCGGTGDAAACSCPASDGVTVYVDPVAGAPDGQPAPTGAHEPASCRYRALAEALAVAAAGQAAVVVASGEVPMTYPVPADLVVPPGVTLRTDDAVASPADRILALGDGVTTSGLTLGAGAVLSGFSVRNAAAPDAAVAVSIACGAGEVARVADVEVDVARDGGRLVTGILVDGACPAVLERVRVAGAVTGVHLARGDLALQQVLVASSAGPGVVVTAGQGGGITLEECTLRDNGDTGLVLGANTARVRMHATRICRNAAVTPRGAFTSKRKVGGVYIAGNPPTDAANVAFTGNAVHGNAGDQVLVSGGAVTWRLDGGADCGLERNLFGGYAPSPAAGLVADSAVVSALRNGWAGGVPAPGFDYQAISGAINATVDASQYCDPPTAAELRCD